MALIIGCPLMTIAPTISRSIGIVLLLVFNIESTTNQIHVNTKVSVRSKPRAMIALGAFDDDVADFFKDFATSKAVAAYIRSVISAEVTKIETRAVPVMA